MNEPNLHDFALAAEQFNALAEGEETLTAADLRKIRDLLLRLIYHVTAVERAGHGTEYDGNCPGEEVFARVVKRFSALPFNFYRVVFDPHDLESTDVAEACFDWAQSYRSHWARHAVSGLSTIEIYRTEDYINVELDAPADGGRDRRL
jgi:hypothetical protein